MFNNIDTNVLVIVATIVMAFLLFGSYVAGWMLGLPMGGEAPKFIEGAITMVLGFIIGKYTEKLNK